MKKFFVLLLLMPLVFIFLFTLPVGAANLKDAFFAGDKPNLDDAASAAGYNTDDPGNRMLEIVATIINVALSLLGVIFLLLIIYAGYLWMTARGDEQQATKARDIIIRSVTGLIIVLAAYAISVFVFTSFTTDTLVS